jgi:hypothetical protein
MADVYDDADDPLPPGIRPGQEELFRAIRRLQELLPRVARPRPTGVPPLPKLFQLATASIPPKPAPKHPSEQLVVAKQTRDACSSSCETGGGATVSPPSRSCSR